MQIYLGGWEVELHAALVYDIAYYKFWGHCKKTNVSPLLVASHQLLPVRVYAELPEV